MCCVHCYNHNYNHNYNQCRELMSTMSTMASSMPCNDNEDATTLVGNEDNMEDASTAERGGREFSCDSDSSSDTVSDDMNPVCKAHMMQTIIEDQTREIAYLRHNLENHVTSRHAIVHAVAQFIDMQTFSSVRPHGLGDLFLAFCGVTSSEPLSQRK